MLNYSHIFKELRTNNYLENFNWLFLKNAGGKKLQSWINYITLLKSEENSYRTKLIYTETKKFLDDTSFKEANIDFNFNSINQNIENNEYIIKHWFKWNHSSCRYDTFSLFYHLIIDNYLFLENTDFIYNNKINNLHAFSKDINKITNHDIFIKRILEFLETSNVNYFSIVDDINNNKKDDIISPLFSLLDGCTSLCISYNKIFKCKKHLALGLISQQHSKCLISFVEDNLALSKLDDIILINYSYEKLPCEIYDYEDRGNIVKGENAEIYYTDIKLPYIITFEFNFSSYSKLKNKKIKNNLKKLFKDKIEIFNEAYINVGVICMPLIDHFTLYIANVDYEKCNINKNNKYYYDSLNNDGLINMIKDDIEQIIDSKYGYIFCYKKLIEKNNWWKNMNNKW